MSGINISFTVFYKLYPLNHSKQNRLSADEKVHTLIKKLKKKIISTRPILLTKRILICI